MAFCTNCGNELAAGARFCSTCGAAVAGGAAQEPQQAQGRQAWQQPQQVQQQPLGRKGFFARQVQQPPQQQWQPNDGRFNGGLQQVKFAVPYFDVFDPRFENFAVPVAVRGTISFRIANLAEFNQIHQSDSMDMETLKSMLQVAVKKYVKAVVANCPAESNVPVLAMDKKLLQITDLVEQFVQDRLLREFGVAVTSVDIGEIDVDKTSEGYIGLERVTKNVETVKTLAQAEMDIDNMRNTRISGAASSASSAAMESWSGGGFSGTSGETWSTGGASSSSGAASTSASTENWS